MRGLSTAEFEEVYGALAQPLLVYLTRRTFDAEVALDLWAETWAAAFASRRRFRGDDATSWIYAIAWRQYAMYVRRGVAERRALRRLGVDRPAVEDADVERLERLSGLGELREAVAHGLEALSAEQREAVRLRVVEELPYSDVARRLSVSEEAARARVSRGLRALAETLDPLKEIEQGAT
jgi:RNA polymerase sigma factor (sigma-70 family)